MGNHFTNNADRIGEALALQVLNEHFGAELFIGSGIELKIEDLASIIYKNINDPEFYGATISLHKKRKYVLLNTSQSLRLRYFTAAHEFWHVLGMSAMINNTIDYERAADRFAAALMLPDSLVRTLFHSLKEFSTGEIKENKIVIQIADISQAPYVAVAKRLIELTLSSHKQLMAYSENDWILIRKDLNMIESPLDQPLYIDRFVDYEERIAKEVETGRLNDMEASKSLANVSPARSAEYAKKRLTKSNEILAVMENNSDDDYLDELFKKRNERK